MHAVLTTVFHRIGRQTDAMLATGVLAVLMIMMIPLPTVVMDLLLATNITISILILLNAIYILKPLEFSVFPSLLLLTTLFRLALNVATTRLILLHGQEGTDAAGRVISSFGQFVVGGNTVVGLIIFLILVLINFIVITKGSTRIAEVAARFTLDALPGKQMAIDADLNAGLINDREAKSRRDLIAREAEFYGAMDGAAKFVRGDAIAGLIITAINLFGGIIIGTLQQNMSLGETVEVYSILTVGDGLVSQIPALVISTAAGIIITRAGGEHNLPTEMTGQFTQYPRAFLVGSGALLFMSLVPGLPFVPFLLLSASLALVAWYLSKIPLEGTADAVVEEEAPPEDRGTQDETALSELLVVDPIRLEVGYGLIDLVESKRDGNLLDQLQAVRRQIAREVGFLLPPVHIKDNLQLGVDEYRILLRGAEVGRATIKPKSLLALTGQNNGAPLEGEQTQEPAFGLPAIWIGTEMRKQAELAGYTVVEPTTVVTTHITEILRKHIHEILDRTHVKKMLDSLSERHGKVIEEIVPSQVSIAVLHRVLQRLLMEWVPIHDLLVILETLADHSHEQLSVEQLVERVRVRLSRNIVQQFLSKGNVMHVFSVDSELEQEMADHLSRYPEWSPPLSVDRWQRFLLSVNDAVARHEMDTAVILTTPELRPALALNLRKALSRVAVLSIAEIPSNITVQVVERIGMKHAG